MKRTRLLLLCAALFAAFGAHAQTASPAQGQAPNMGCLGTAVLGGVISNKIGGGNAGTGAAIGSAMNCINGGTAAAGAKPSSSSGALPGGLSMGGVGSLGAILGNIARSGAPQQNKPQAPTPQGN